MSRQHSGSDPPPDQPELYQQIFETVDDAIFIIHVEHEEEGYTFRYGTNNPSHQQRTGLTHDQLNGTTPAELFETEQAAELTANYTQCVEQQTPINYEETLDLPAGITHWQTTLTPIIKNDQVTKIIGVSRDLTEQIQQQKKLERIQQRIELLLEATTAAVYEVDPNTESVTTYPTPNPLVSKEIQTVEEFVEYVHPEDRETIADSVRLSSPGESYSLEYRIKTDQGIRWVRDYAKQITTDSVGEPTAVTIGIIIDITEQKQRHEQLKRQNDRLDEFASVISHDLRNPLTVAQGRAGLLADELDSPHITPLVESLDRIEAIVEDTLTLARHGETIDEREQINLTNLVGKCWSQISTDNATLEIADDLTLNGDFSRLQQVFENLFRNAVEHGTEQVTVRVGQLQDSNGWYVEDDGPGIPESDREQIFEVGYSSANDGTGFGLAIVKRIVEAHGWNIHVTTGTDGGARFEITNVELDSA